MDLPAIVWYSAMYLSRTKHKLEQMRSAFWFRSARLDPGWNEQLSLKSVGLEVLVGRKVFSALTCMCRMCVEPCEIPVVSCEVRGMDWFGLWAGHVAGWLFWCGCCCSGLGLAGGRVCMGRMWG